MTKTLHCPICHRPVAWEGNTFRPFCSERCQTIDLGSWAAGWYRIPGQSLGIDSEPTENADPPKEGDPPRRSSQQ